MTESHAGQIDLNTADEKALIQKLKISPRLAKRILALRPYASVADLQKVWGMDADTLQRILPLVRIERQVEPAKTSVTEMSFPEEIYVATRAKEKTIPLQASIMAAPSSDKEENTTFGLLPSALKAGAISEEKPKSTGSWRVNLALCLILLVGAYFRFVGLNWDENHHQHPDERSITMVADGIRGVSGFSEYFDTANSTLNPLRFGSYTYGMLPLFVTRMVADWLHMADYDRITLVGRALSGLFDLAALWLLFMLGRRLYDTRTGLLAAALGAACAFLIQLSHFFTVDSFSTVFVIASFYFAISAIPWDAAGTRIPWRNVLYFVLFGCMVGFAGACKINALPVFGVLILAGLARGVMEWKTPDFRRTVLVIGLGWVLAGLFAFIAFRVCQPYAFAGPGFLGVSLNPRWMDVIKEVTDQVAGNSDWPPNHHWTNRSIAYAWENMVVWGMGIPLGLAAWMGWIWAGWRIWKGDWRRHLLPFVWVGAYFLWQNSQFWRYMRYFVPIYPFLILFAAWALWELYDRSKESRLYLLSNGIKNIFQSSGWRNSWKGAAGVLAIVIVLAGTYVYAIAFDHMYTVPLTRIEASRWMLQNLPGPINLQVDSGLQGTQSYPVSVFNRQVINPDDPQNMKLKINASGVASRLTTVDVSQVAVSVYFRITRDAPGENILTEGRLSIPDDTQESDQVINVGDINLDPGITYYFHYQIRNSSRFSFSQVNLRNENSEIPPLPIPWSYQDQAPGYQEGSLPFDIQTAQRINRLEITDFQQAFVPTQTTLQASLYAESDDQTPLATTSTVMDFSSPGLHLNPTLSFSPVPVQAGKEYRVQYQIEEGGPIHLSGVPFTLETSWDDALPLGVDGYDPLGGIYVPLNLELYEPDTQAKRDQMIQILTKSEYIVISSNRAFDSMPRLPLRYPLSLKYYQALFDCDCSGDDLENRAYGLRPSFASPLGFDLVAVFENPPTIGMLQFPDQIADESFTVYDHPRVMIFKKANTFSVGRITALLNSVDLDSVIFQTPMAYTSVPTAMQLPADRLAAQTNGGTWSEMFQRASFWNTNPAVGAVAWYFLLFSFGVVVFPILFRVFAGLPDRGYPLARMAGLLLFAWLAWILGSLKILLLRNGPFSCACSWFSAGLRSTRIASVKRSWNFSGADGDIFVSRKHCSWWYSSSVYIFAWEIRTCGIPG